MIKNSSYINHQKDIIEIKSLMSQVEKHQRTNCWISLPKYCPIKYFVQLCGIYL